MLGESSTHGTVETSTDSSGGRRRLRPGPAPMNSDRVRSAVSRRDARARGARQTFDSTTMKKPKCEESTAPVADPSS
jgi:hypothetical protein